MGLCFYDSLRIITSMGYREGYMSNKLRGELKEILDAPNSEDTRLDALEAFIEKKVTKKMQKFQSSLDLHDETQDGSMRAGLLDVMYTIYGNALYPTQVDMVFDGDDFKALEKEFGKADENMIRFETEYGPVVLHHSPK